MSKRPGDPGYADGWCIHYRSPSQGLGKPDLETCEAGVRYDKFAGTKFGARPCFLDAGKPRPGSAPCDCLRVPTPEEIAAHEAWVANRHLDLMKVFEAISPWRIEHRKARKGGSRTMDCPACGATNSLHLTIAASNGHVHGHCQTENCVSWME